MKIAVAQLNLTVGAFEKNILKIKEAFLSAEGQRARILLTPELGLCGYPLHDLLHRQEILERTAMGLKDLIAFTAGKSCALVLGHVQKSPYAFGRPIQNAVSVLENGKVVFSQAKSLLPTYDVFDEARYFEPAREIKLWDCDGKKVAIAICEDLWAKDLGKWENPLYEKDPVDQYRKLGAEMLISVSASPFEFLKWQVREKLHQDIAVSLRVPVIYINQVGANDEVLFDGASFLVNADGKFSGRLKFFGTGFAVAEVEPNGSAKWISGGSDQATDSHGDPLQVLVDGLVCGIKDYFEKTHHDIAILGLSGGVDSALVACLAAKALGPDRVLGVAMPSQYSSGHSLYDAEELAKRLKIRFQVRPIKFLYSTFKNELEGMGAQARPLQSVALENLQARIRGSLLMSLANHFQALTLTTGNKSEIAMGYCTSYGDMVGALAPIGDLYKTQVYEICRWINEHWGNPLPENTLAKPPSAELRPDQKDEDSLPPYAFLDPLLEDYLEEGKSVEELVRVYESNLPTKPGWVLETIKKIELNEFKRRQAAPTLKVSKKAFGIGRRVPIAKSWDVKTFWDS